MKRNATGDSRPAACRSVAAAPGHRRHAEPDVRLDGTVRPEFQFAAALPRSVRADQPRLGPQQPQRRLQGAGVEVIRLLDQQQLLSVVIVGRRAHEPDASGHSVALGALLGAAIGTAGAILDQVGGLIGWQGALSIIVGIVMLLIGLSLLGVLPPIEVALASLTSRAAPMSRRRRR